MQFVHLTGGKEAAGDVYDKGGWKSKEDEVQNMATIENYFENKDYEDDYEGNKEKLFYAVMYRQWEIAAEMIEENHWSWEEIKDWHFRDYEGITIEMCFQFNLDFLKSIKNKPVYKKICERLGEGFGKLKNENETNLYDDKRFCKEKNQSVLDVFWNGDQPVLNLKYFEKQTMAARQAMKNGVSMVLDEVGTGKTVAGIFTMQQVIQERITQNKERPDECLDQVSVLIICPYNKREDWHSDILRQLGREPAVIGQTDPGEVLMQKSSRRGAPHIYISGNIGGIGDGSTQQLKKSFLNYHGEPWDLVIIDECHNCFSNYEDVRAKRMLLLTATPIVVNSKKGVRDFDNYKVLIYKILDKYIRQKIDPIKKQSVSEDDIFVCNFKEDIFENIKINRQIVFEECDRDPRRQDWFEKIWQKEGFFSAIFADQDDQRLADKMKKIIPDGDYRIEKNDKLEKLAAIVLGEGKYREYTNDSFLIFCETTDTVDLIYEKIFGYASDELMIGRLYSGIAEIKNKRANKDNLLPALREHIRSGKKGILIITGKSGSTGLNLGEFHAVVHYELPFSSNALEQRFGRIERAEDLIGEEGYSGKRKRIENKMIFLLNKAVDGQLDFEANRMLYYAVHKIHITVKYMPVRNTVLFHPAYMEKVKREALEAWGPLGQEFGREDTDIKRKLDDYFEYAKACDQVQKIIDNIKEDKIKNKLIGKSIEEKVGILLTDAAREKIEDIGTIQRFDETYRKDGAKQHAAEMKAMERKLEAYIAYYLWLWNTLSFWGIECRIEDRFEELYKKYTAYDEETEAMDKTEAGEETGEETDEETKVMDKIKAMDDARLDSIKEAFQKLKEIERADGRYFLIKGSIKSLLEVLEEKEVNLSDSGVFYLEDSKIKNMKF